MRSLVLLVDIKTMSISDIITQMTEEFGRWSAADLVELNLGIRPNRYSNSFISIETYTRKKSNIETSEIFLVCLNAYG
jgi:hypothetical protein